MFNKAIRIFIMLPILTLSLGSGQVNGFDHGDDEVETKPRSSRRSGARGRVGIPEDTSHWGTIEGSVFRETNSGGKLKKSPEKSVRVFIYKGSSVKQSKLKEGEIFVMPYGVDTKGQTLMEQTFTDSKGRFKSKLEPGEYTVFAEIEDDKVKLVNVDGAYAESSKEGTKERFWTSITVEPKQSTQHTIVYDATVH